MKNHLNFSENQRPSYECGRELLAALLTVSGLYPEKSSHLIMDADANLYSARFICHTGACGPDMVTEWNVSRVIHKFLPSAPYTEL
jgi:hypothetical protein